MKLSLSRPTIGFIAADAYEEITRAVWQGAAEAAQAAEANLIFFAGGALHDPIGNRQESNVLYELVGPQLVDGLLVMSSSIDFAATRQEMETFIQRMRGSGEWALPVVSLEEAFDGMACLLKDDYGGMLEAIGHLIETHGRRRIVFLRGPAGFLGSQRRYQAYLDALEKYHIVFDPNLVTAVPTSWGYHEGLESFKSFLDEHALRPRFDFDAVVGANDEMALAALNVLQQRGLRIPDDISVSGFDDLALAGSTSPALTTVRPPFLEMGMRAVEILLGLINQGHNSARLPTPETMPTQPVIRHSCGCQLPTIAKAAVTWLEEQVKVYPGKLPGKAKSKEYLTVIPGLATALAPHRKSITQAMARTTDGLPEAHRWAGQILNGFIREIDNSEPGVFLSALDEVLTQVILCGGRVKDWQLALSVLRLQILPFLVDPAMQLKADNLWHQGRVMIGEMSWRNQSWKRLKVEERARQLREVGARLATMVSIEGITDVLAQELPNLGIPRSYLMLFETPQPEKPYLEQQQEIELQHLAVGGVGQVRMVLGYDQNGRISISEEDTCFASKNLLPTAVWERSKRYSLLVEALYLRGESLGYIVFETSGCEGGREGDIYDALKMQISSAIKSARLHQEASAARLEAETGWKLAEERRRQAEEADQLKSRFLSMVSHELRTPLNVISGLSENLLGDFPRVQELPKEMINSTVRDLERIQGSAQHLDNLIRDVLDLAVSQVGQLRLSYDLIDVNETLRPVFEIGDKLAREKGIGWRLELASHLPCILWDCTRLRQVALNLVTNAVKFTENGEVVVTTSERVNPEGMFVEISVLDTGMGIPSEEQALIFEEFQRSERATTRGYGGLGLGLAVCKKLVELGGGKIRVESSGDVGGGSTFSFCLPAQDGTGLQRFQSIVLVSKQIKLLAFLDAYLTDSGYNIEVINPKLDAVWQKSILENPPGAIILDFDTNVDEGKSLRDAVMVSPELQRIPILVFSMSGDGRNGSVSNFFSDLPLPGQPEIPGWKPIPKQVHLTPKPLDGESLVRSLRRWGIAQSECSDPILVVDDEPVFLEMHTQLVETQFPSVRVLQARNGREAMRAMENTLPGLVLLDLMMPEIDGYQVLQKMRESEILRSVPVIVLTAQNLNDEDMQQLNQGVAAVLEKGLFSTEETLSQVEAVLAHTKHLGGEARRVARRAMAYMHEHYREDFNRKQIAAHVGISQEYLSTCFRRETGLTPTIYLERYRIKQAKKLLETTDMSISEIAQEVGIFDSSYFGRIFRREVGVTPAAYRKGERLT
jgi:signal transduction histidine kinase/DNA-binding LacI/PurR family transcriptional regulator/AraC-like DNA-binding protein